MPQPSEKLLEGGDAAPLRCGEMGPSGVLRVLRHLPGLGIPGRLRSPEDVDLWLLARIAVQHTGRHEVVVALADLVRDAGAAPAAKPYREALRPRKVESG